MDVKIPDKLAKAFADIFSPADSRITLFKLLQVWIIYEPDSLQIFVPVILSKEAHPENI